MSSCNTLCTAIGLLIAAICTSCKPDTPPPEHRQLRNEIEQIRTLEKDGLNARKDVLNALHALIEKNPQTCIPLLTNQGKDWMELPDLLASLALERLQESHIEEANRLLEASLELHPTNALSKGILGISKAMQRDYQHARDLLEEAESWQFQNPWIDHALGSILLQSQTTADRARAKVLLLRAVEENHDKLSLPAALLLLTSDRVPIYFSDIERCMPILNTNKSAVLAPDFLSPPHLAILTQSILTVSDEYATELAHTLLSNKETPRPIQRKIALQMLAAGINSPIKDWLDLSPQALDRELNPLRVILAVSEGRFPEALEHLQDHHGMFHQDELEIFFTQIIPKAGLTLSEEATLIEHCLLHESMPAFFTLQLISRITSITPLHTQKWIHFAIDRTLNDLPVETALWIASTNEFATATGALRNDWDGEKATLATAEVYIMQGSPQKAEEILQQATASNPAKAYLLTRCAHARGDLTEAQQLWNTAYENAFQRGDYTVLKNLGILASQCGWSALAHATLNEVYNAGTPMSLPQLMLLQELSLAHDGAQSAFRIAKMLHEQIPADPTLFNNFAYYNFISGTQDDADLAEMEKLVQEYPDVTEYRLTLALGKLQAGYPKEAMQLLVNVSLDWEKISNRSRLVYTAVLNGNGQNALATGLAGSVRTEHLAPEEIELLNRL